MCGIVGYTGHRPASPIIYQGLEKLEYRGYDSAGIAVQNGTDIQLQRAEGKLVNLKRCLEEVPLEGTCGIGHTRWATHGKPSVENAHPHRAGGVMVVHNGIIENHAELRQELRGKGHNFRSETDTETIVHLIEQHLKEGLDFEQAVRKSLERIRGTYAVAIICEQEPGKLIAAKLGSPLVVGQGDGESFVGSDIPALLPFTRDMVFLEDGEFVVFDQGTISYSDLAGTPLQKQVKTITWSAAAAEKGGYRHFMLKEIYEQPRAIADTLGGRITAEGEVVLDELGLSDAEIAAFDRVSLVACGTSWHAALVGKFLIEGLARIPVEVDIASEFRYRDPIVDAKTLAVFISQSGETADTLAALNEAGRKEASTVCICNVVDSSIARKSRGVIYTHAGPEIGVASTKAFTTQLVALVLLALRLGKAHGTLAPERARKLCDALLALPRIIEETLKLDDQIAEIAKTIVHCSDALFLGRGNQYPIALEGALKLKEISYIHAEGYPAGEMKHGPIALIDENMPVVVVVPDGPTYEKAVSNLEEVRSRGGRVIAVTSRHCPDLEERCDAVIVVPKIDHDVMPIITSIPMQLLAYHVAVLKGTDVDQPRNLAKSVTVE